MKNWMSIFMVLLCLAGCAPVTNPTVATTGCVPTGDAGGESQPTAAETQPEISMDENRTIFAIDPTKGSPFNNGKFEGWGTSLCWWANRIGYSDTLAQKAADLLYNAETGLGMNIARYNIGGGDDPSHRHITRTDSMMPGFWTIDETTGEHVFDGTKDENQRNVLLRAKAACGSDFIVEAFSNSPPYYMTESGCSSGAVYAGQNNLRADQVEAFAEYLVQVMLYYKENYGIDFQSISPMNEPNTAYWEAYSPKQEGCHVSPGESQSAILLATQKALAEKGLDNILLVGTDETSTVLAARSFEKLSAEAKNAIARIDTHTYKIGLMEELQALAVANEKNLWMSEVDGDYVLGQNSGEMGAGLWLANKMISDIQSLMPSAWILWQGIDNHVSSEGYMGNQDSGMPDLSRGYWGLTVVDHDHEEIHLTKKYYAFGQLSRYIRPGYRIFATTEKGMLAAYSDEEKKLVIVAVNVEETEVEAGFSLGGFQYDGGMAQAIRTSQSENWAALSPIPVQQDMLRTTLAPYSITTFIIDHVTIPGEGK
jgi:O-glycosyl hydrolase